MHKGSCLCGAVTIEVEGDLPIVEACHCNTCRKWSGHYHASVDVPRDSVSIKGEEHIKWFKSSQRARRGFCQSCGSSLFFDPIDKVKHNWIAILMGVFDTPTNTHVGLHIFTAEKGDYYQITDGLPQNEH